MFVVMQQSMYEIYQMHYAIVRLSFDLRRQLLNGR